MAIGVHACDDATEGGVTLRQIRRRHQRARAGVFENVGDPVRRILGIDRHVGRARLEDSQERRVGIDGPREQHRDERPPADAARAEVPRQTVRALLQFEVSNFFLAEDCRDSLRARIDLRLENLLQKIEADGRIRFVPRSSPARLPRDFRFPNPAISRAFGSSNRSTLGCVSLNICS